MPPAIECGTCGFSAKTAHEPATDAEMTGLMDEYAAHALSNLTNLLLVQQGQASGKVHRLKMFYYELTPKGFDSAKVITGITQRMFHSRY